MLKRSHLKYLRRFLIRILKFLNNVKSLQTVEVGNNTCNFKIFVLYLHFFDMIVIRVDSFFLLFFRHIHFTVYVRHHRSLIYITINS